MEQTKSEPIIVNLELKTRLYIDGNLVLIEYWNEANQAWVTLTQLNRHRARLMGLVK